MGLRLLAVGGGILVYWVSEKQINGIIEEVLNFKGLRNVLEKIKRPFHSLFATSLCSLLRFPAHGSRE